MTEGSASETKLSKSCVSHAMITSEASVESIRLSSSGSSTTSSSMTGSAPKTAVIIDIDIEKIEPIAPICGGLAGSPAAGAAPSFSSEVSARAFLPRSRAWIMTAAWSSLGRAVERFSLNEMVVPGSAPGGTTRMTFSPDGTVIFSLEPMRAFGGTTTSYSRNSSSSPFVSAPLPTFPGPVSVAAGGAVDGAGSVPPVRDFELFFLNSGMLALTSRGSSAWMRYAGKPYCSAICNECEPVACRQMRRARGSRAGMQ